VERELTVDDLLICDGERVAQGIAGVMGGAAAEVSDATTEVLLESAYFEPSGIAKTSKRLGLRSEASARFERGVDPNDVGSGAARAMELFAVVAAATPAPGAIDVYPKPIERAHVTIRTERVNTLLATSLSEHDVQRLLTPLGVEFEGATAIVPTWRPDIEREIDLVEEVARRIGLDQIQRTVPSNPEKVGSLTTQQKERRAVADVLIGAGYDEVYTLPLLSAADLARAGAPTESVIEVANPLRAEESVLRPAVMPGLLRAVGHNAAHGNPDVAIFELGRVFAPPEAGQTLPVERLHLAVARSGRIVRSPYEADRPVTAHDAVALIEAIAQELRLAEWSLVEASPPGYHPVRAANIVVGGDIVGSVGEIDAEVVDALALSAPVVALELDVDAVLAAARVPRAASPLSRYPASTIDLAFVVNDDVPAGDVLRTLRAAGGDLLESIRLFDVFRSDAIGAGKVSLAFALEFRAPDRTLTDAEVGELRKQCIDAVMSAFGAELRG
jgi:phenylalanyl-tRNA synthetase beta chain